MPFKAKPENEKKRKKLSKRVLLKRINAMIYKIDGIEFWADQQIKLNSKILLFINSPLIKLHF